VKRTWSKNSKDEEEENDDLEEQDNGNVSPSAKHLKKQTQKLENSLSPPDLFTID
jgi:hypothetical protein